MAEVILNTKHQQRNDTAANWLLVNPILLRGELGVELDTGKMKIGNGRSAWSALPYLGVGITQTDVLNFVYPVGSIKMTTVNETPGNSIGGIWERWGNGRMPIAVDENQAEFAECEQIGGEREHTLTTDEMPAHEHTVTLESSGTVTSLGLGTSSAAAVGRKEVRSTSAGGGRAHNNMPPFITCYFWKRIG